MSNEILKTENLGSFEEIVYIVKNAITEEKRPLKDVEKYCMSSRTYIRLPTKGIVSLLAYVNIISLENNQISLTQNGIELRQYSDDINLFGNKLVNLLLNQIYQDQLADFMDEKVIRYNAYLAKYSISNSSFSLSYSSLKNFLIKNGFLELETNSSEVLIITDNLLEILREHIRINKHERTLARLKRIMELKEEAGKEAEAFVLAFERKRLTGHENLDKIEIISELDTTAGFDIVSFNSLDSKKFDRFIEVKSYVGEVSFYWSRNEIDVAKIKRDAYCLYLVNRAEIGKTGYEPIIISNPYNSIFSDSEHWTKSCESYFFLMK